MGLDDEDEDEDERGTMRVIPSARLNPCVCDGGGRAATAADVDADVDLPCRVSESAIGTVGTAWAAVAADADAPFFDSRASFATGGGGVGTGTRCGYCD